MPTRTAGPAVAAGTVLALALLGACSSGSDDAPDAAPPAPSTAAAPPPGSTPTTSTAPAPTASSAGPSSAPPTTAAAPVGAAPCAASQLATTVRPDVGGGAAGSTYVRVVFANEASTPCTLSGQPGVSYVVGTARTPVGAPAAREGTPAVVELAPGGSASAQLRVQDPGTVDRETCQSSPVDGLRVSPPDQKTAAFLPQAGATCADPSVVLLTVGPVQAG